ncbi:Secreted and transmembrane protein 1A [Cricetulus griseus]|uniref:Secreted and transmembrane protein 1A n=1 Tax=Cricetulus griseus TaxID=10029 RepID=G3GXE1_CRIGR|nr:Secreted and transmembrane protein 1A [Cricetulus griseus]
MKRCPLVSTAHIARVVCILLLAASVNAQNESWDSPLCTESALSVPRGSRAVMTCNISNTFADVSIWLEGQIIFNEAPQGNSRLDDWELQVQGGQARLMINDTQDVHTGLYLWQLHGHQRDYKNFTLTVSAWDNPTCTESEVSAPRGNRVVMACNISNTFRDVTIGLTANGKTSTIFNTKPPGNYFNDSWQLQIQGGQAYLVITDVQDIHAGQYVWRLNGNQRPPDQFIVLNVTEIPVLMASEGESVNITCSTSGDLQGIYLKQSWPQASKVTYFEDGKEPTVDKRFSGRIDFSGSQNNLTITMRLLRKTDIGIYTCSAVTKNRSDGLSTMVMVTGDHNSMESFSRVKIWSLNADSTEMCLGYPDKVLDVCAGQFTPLHRITGGFTKHFHFGKEPSYGPESQGALCDWAPLCVESLAMPGPSNKIPVVPSTIYTAAGPSLLFLLGSHGLAEGPHTVLYFYHDLLALIYKGKPIRIMPQSTGRTRIVT